VGDYSTIEIRGDNEDLKESLKGAVDMFREFGNKITALFQQATGIYSFDDAISKIKKGIADFEHTQEGMRKLGYAIDMAGNKAGFTLDQLRAMNEELRKISKYSADAITSAQTAMMKFKNIRVDTFQDALASATDLAEYLSMDLNEAVNLLGAALNSPRKGLEDLEDAGVDFTKQQKAQIEAMLRMNNVVGAQRIIMKAMTDQMGGAGMKAADTFGIRMQRLAESTDEVWETIGGMLVPWINKAIDIMNTASAVVSALAKEWVSKWIDMSGSTEDAIKMVTDLLAEWGLALIDTVTTAFTYIQTAMQTWESTAKAIWLSVKSAALLMFADLIDAAIDWVKKAIEIWPLVEQKAREVWEKVVELANWGVEQLKTYWDEFVKYSKSVWNTLWVNIESFWAKLKLLMTGQDPGEWLWKDFTNKSRAVLAEIPAELGMAGEAGKKSMLDSMAGFSASLRGKAHEASAGIADAMDPFNKRFNDNLKDNQKKVDDFKKHIMDIIAETGYKNIEGIRNTKKFRGLGGKDEDKEYRPEGVGQIEDFAAAHMRIQSAAMKPPTLAELEKQTKIMEEERLIQQAIRDYIITERKILRAPMPKVPTLSDNAGFVE
jgi:hypothetical protein